MTARRILTLIALRGLLLYVASYLLVVTGLVIWLLSAGTPRADAVGLFARYLPNLFRPGRGEWGDVAIGMAASLTALVNLALVAIRALRQRESLRAVSAGKGLSS